MSKEDVPEDFLVWFEARPYGNNGYPVYRTWPLDNGSGRGGDRQADFVEQSAARDYARYRNEMLIKCGHSGLETEAAASDREPEDSHYRFCKHS